ncbi:hypothetical protein IAR55_003023 [Kwoniella newhampshirensis]|uniref:Uncharacterized protein n=1 Tax=Kwoniella newhampshirensis TaxID=1651941 RepID=A0AAW0YQT5_9TREE
MESLSPECTPMKHRYDSCFNLWFEGYLQPALDASRANSSSTPSSSASSSTFVTGSDSAPVANHHHVSTTPSTQQTKRPLITSWANAFPSRTRAKAPAQISGARTHVAHTPDYPDEEIDVEPIDTSGKTRAQIKAEEYERACGKAWIEYQACLKKAIAQNESLSTLLEQAREEHPLRSQDGLAGTTWDSKADFSAAVQ